MGKNSQQVIMISGANRGIGKAIREKLQSENYLLSLGPVSYTHLTLPTKA